MRPGVRVLGTQRVGAWHSESSHPVLCGKGDEDWMAREGEAWQGAGWIRSDAVRSDQIRSWSRFELLVLFFGPSECHLSFTWTL